MSRSQWRGPRRYYTGFPNTTAGGEAISWPVDACAYRRGDAIPVDDLPPLGEVCVCVSFRHGPGTYLLLL
jgi:hypothetical protein